MSLGEIPEDQRGDPPPPPEHGAGDAAIEANVARIRAERQRRRAGEPPPDARARPRRVLRSLFATAAALIARLRGRRR